MGTRLDLIKRGFCVDYDLLNLNLKNKESFVFPNICNVDYFKMRLNFEDKIFDFQGTTLKCTLNDGLNYFIASDYHTPYDKGVNLKELPSSLRNLLWNSFQEIFNDPCFLYLMKGSDFYKIGITNNINKRNHQIATKLPFVCETLRTFKFNSRSEALMIEGLLHRAFSSRNTNGEWFKLNPLNAFKK